jgi:hypothetical protein
MMVDGAEEGLFRGPIDVLAPYSQIYLVDASSESASVACRTLRRL